MGKCDENAPSPSGVQRCLPPSAFMDINENGCNFSLSMNQSPEGTEKEREPEGEPEGFRRVFGGSSTK